MTNDAQHVQDSKARFRAFISYNHADMAASRRVHQWLETYQLPFGVNVDDDLVKGRKLGRFFRDEEEMAAAADIGSLVRGAIEEAESLIVICSPNSARSKWVNSEIEHFRKTGRARKIFAVIIDGVPNSGNPETECFPEALRVTASDDPEDMPIEPLGLDIRKESKPKFIARLAAGLLSIDFDTLWRRDRRRARKKRAQFSLATLTAIATILVAGLLTMRAFGEQRSMQLASASQNQINQGRLDSAVRLSILASRDSVLTPAHSSAEPILLDAARQSLLVSNIEGLKEDVIHMAVDENGQSAVLVGEYYQVRLIDLQNGNLIREIRPSSGPPESHHGDNYVTGLNMSPDGSVFAISMYGNECEEGDNCIQPTGEWTLIDAQTGELRPRLDNFVPEDLRAPAQVPSGVVDDFTAEMIVTLDKPSTTDAAFYHAMDMNMEWNVVPTAFSNDGSLFAQIDMFGRVTVWETETGKIAYYMSLPDLHQDPDYDFETTHPDLLNTGVWGATRLGFLNGDLLVFRQWSDSLRVSLDETPTATAIPIDHGGAMLSVIAHTTSDNERLMWLVLSDGRLQSIDMDRFQSEAIYPAPSNDIRGSANPTGHTSLIISEALNKAVMVYSDGRMVSWMLNDFAPPTVSTVNMAFGVHSDLYFSPENDETVYIEDARTVRITGTTTNHATPTHRMDRLITQSAQLADGRIVTTTSSGDIQIWDPVLPPVNPETISYQTESGTISADAIQFSGDGRRLIASTDFTATVWDTQTGDGVASFASSDREVDIDQLGYPGIALNQDGSVAALAGHDALTIWDVESGELISEIADAPRFINAASFSEDGRRLSVIGLLGDIHIYDQDDQEQWSLSHNLTDLMLGERDINRFLVGRLRAQPSHGIALSPDGSRLLASTGWGRERFSSVVFWDANSGSILSRFEEDRRSTGYARFSGDGQSAVVTFLAPFRFMNGDQPAAQVYYALEGDRKTWLRSSLIQYESTYSRYADLNEDGSRLVSGSENGLSLWDVQANRRLLTFDHGMGSLGLPVHFTDYGTTILAVRDTEIRKIPIGEFAPSRDRRRVGLPGPIDDLCQSGTGILNGNLRYLTRRDIEAAPSLLGREGEDVCQAPAFEDELARAFGLD